MPLRDGSKSCAAAPVVTVAIATLTVTMNVAAIDGENAQWSKSDFDLPMSGISANVAADVALDGFAEGMVLAAPHWLETLMLCPQVGRMSHSHGPQVILVSV